jgi:ferrous iron transport protein A
MGSEPLVPLGFMNPGDRGTLKEIRGLRHRPEVDCRPSPRREKRYLRGHKFHHDRGHRLEHRLNHMGLVPGEEVTVVRNNAPGPVVVAVKGSRLCLGRGLACKLMVHPSGGSPSAEGGRPVGAT